MVLGSTAAVHGGKLGDVIYRAATGREPDLADAAPWEHTLGSMLEGYARTTQAWPVADGLRGGLHAQAIRAARDTRGGMCCRSGSWLMR